MRIGLVHAGYELLPLFQVFHRYDYERHIFSDTVHAPRGNKSHQLQEERIRVGIDYLQDKVDVLIVPPVAELSSIVSTVPIVPLFKTYLHNYVFPHSLVGKLGLLVDEGDTTYIQSLIATESASYTLSSTQAKTKSFQYPFSYRAKTVPMRKHFLPTFGSRDWIVRNIIKHDLRYFHDAAVDTLVPTDWSMLFWHQLIKQRLNRKKMRFHGLDVVESLFLSCTKHLHIVPETYAVFMYATDVDALYYNKKWYRLLTRGDAIQYTFTHI